MNKNLLLPLFILIFGCQAPSDSLSSDRPNILLIMSDDQGWGDAGYKNHPQIKTPNLDQMAANGLVFHRFYSAAPVCSPTRGSVLTGRHPVRYGIYYANEGHLPAYEITLPEILNKHGYITGHFGKWHLGIMDKNTIDSNRGGFSRNTQHYSPPWENGYDVTFATEAAVPTYNPMKVPGHRGQRRHKHQAAGDAFGTYYWTGPGCIATDNLQGDDSRVIMDRVIPFIHQSMNMNKPFFATIWFHTPHSPVVAGKEVRQLYNGLTENEQHYFGCITAMDHQIGRLRNELRKLHIAENTMIWFCSDNGPAARGGGPGWNPGGRQQGSTGGLKGRKGSLYEGGIRVPGILEWPARITNGKETDVPAVTSDYLPTILDFLEITKTPLPVLDGISLKPIILEVENHRSKGIGFQSRFEGKMYQAWITDQYKLIGSEAGEPWELYDISADPAESENIIKYEPHLARELKQDLQQWIKGTSSSPNN